MVTNAPALGQAEAGFGDVVGNSRRRPGATCSWLADRHQTFNSADYVGGKYTVFDVGGNKYRVVGVIHYNTQRIYIHGVFTHEEYDKWTKEIRGKST